MTKAKKQVKRKKVVVNKIRKKKRVILHKLRLQKADNQLPLLNKIKQSQRQVQVQSLQDKAL